MALGPQEPLHQGERRLLDRAIFLGDLARTGKSQETRSQENQQKRNFHQLLGSELNDQDQDENKTAEDTSSKTRFTADNNDDTPEQIKDDQLENRKDAQRQATAGGFEQAERATSSQYGQWRNPLLNMGAAMVNVPQQLQAQSLEKKESTQKQHYTRGKPATKESSKQVDPGLLQALRQSGLAHPLTGLTDPRLKGSAPQLGPEWTIKTKGTCTICRWEVSAGQRQVLRWSHQESLLETVAAGQRQVVQKIGEQFWSQTSAWVEGSDFEVT